MSENPSAPAVPLLLSQSEEELRGGLTTLFRGLLRVHSVRVPLLYVGPVRREAPIVSAIEQAGGAADGRQVALAPLRAFPRVLDRLSRAEDAEPLWVVWGEEPPESLPSAFQEVVKLGARVFDTRSNPVAVRTQRVTLKESVLTAAEAGKLGFPLLLSVREDVLSLHASEAQLWLEVMRYDVVSLAEVPPLDAASFVFPEGERPALVVRLRAVPEDALRQALSQLAARAADRGVALVLLGVPGAIPAVLSSVAWSAAVACAVHVDLGQEELAPAVHGVRWPALHKLMLGVPEMVAERAALIHVPPDTQPLHLVLQTAEVWSQDGYFLIYTERAFGWIRILDGRVVSASRLGDAPAASVSEVSARVRSMGLWPHARVTFLVEGASHVSGEPVGGGVAMHMVGMDVSRTLEEAGRGEISEGTLAPEIPRLAPHQVAAELVKWGMRASAADLLRDAERASGWSAEDDLLLGYLAVDRDPAEALARMRHAVERLAKDPGGAEWGLQADATLNAMLLDVRLQPANAPSAWAMVQRWVQEAGEDWISTPAHAALLVELAVRARQTEAALHYRNRALASIPAGHPLEAVLGAYTPVLAPAFR